MSDERNDDDEEGSDGGLFDKAREVADRIAGDDEDDGGRRAPRPTPGPEDEPDADTSDGDAGPDAEGGNDDDRPLDDDASERTGEPDEQSQETPPEATGQPAAEDTPDDGGHEAADGTGTEADEETAPDTDADVDESTAGTDSDADEETGAEIDEEADGEPEGETDGEPDEEADGEPDEEADQAAGDTGEAEADEGAADVEDDETDDEAAEPIHLELRGPDEPPAVGEEVTATVVVDDVPVEGATVETSTGERVRTDADGQATLTVEQPGEVAVTADAEGSDRPVLGDRLDLTVRERRELGLSAERTELPVGESTVFEVTDGEDEPVEGVAVTAGETTVTTDEDGRCEVAFGDAGEVTVTAEKSTDEARYGPAETTVAVLTRPEWIDHLEERRASLASRSEQYREHLEATRAELAEYRSAYIERLENRVDDLEGDRDDLRQQVEFLEDRHEKELQRTVADLVEPLVYDVRDQMVTALEHSDEETDLREALAGSVQELEDVLAYQADVELVQPEPGDELDRDVHHPIGTDPDAGGADEVVDVTQPGIVVDGEVVEKAKVTVGDD